jgi:hypothetical protein
MLQNSYTRAKTVELLAFLMNVGKTVASRLIVYEKGWIYFLNDTEVNFVLWGGGLGEEEEGGFHALTVSSKVEVYQHLSFFNMAATLAEVFPCFFLSRKANTMV